MTACDRHGRDGIAVETHEWVSLYYGTKTLTAPVEDTKQWLCPQCREELEELLAMFNRYRPGVEFEAR